MNNTLKVIFLILAGIYIISPVDLVPGSLDDILLGALSIAAAVKKPGNKKLE